MSLTILVDRADNGNRFLCKECQHAFKRSGNRMEDDIICTVDKPFEVKYPVTRCNKFSLLDLDTYNSPGYKILKRNAMYLDKRGEVTTGKKNPNFMKFITYADAVNERLVYDED